MKFCPYCGTEIKKLNATMFYCTQCSIVWKENVWTYGKGVIIEEVK